MFLLLKIQEFFKNVFSDNEHFAWKKHVEQQKTNFFFWLNVKQYVHGQAEKLLHVLKNNFKHKFTV